MPCTVLQRYVATRLVALIMLRHDFESCKGNSLNAIKNYLCTIYTYKLVDG